MTGEPLKLFSVPKAGKTTPQLVKTPPQNRIGHQIFAGETGFPALFLTRQPSHAARLPASRFPG
jgi:hypothetical protein